MILIVVCEHEVMKHIRPVVCMLWNETIFYKKSIGSKPSVLPQSISVPYSGWRCGYIKILCPIPTSKTKISVFSILVNIRWEGRYDNSLNYKVVGDDNWFM